MCGRYSLSAPPDVLAEHFGLEEVPELTPRYNIAPTQDVAVVRPAEERSGRRLDLVRWGLLPPGVREPAGGAGGGGALINARAETVMERPSFRGAFRKRRCLVPADGFYEWRRIGGRKQPYYFTLRDARPYAFAGLWERWIASDGHPVDSCVILTTEPNGLVRPIHDRMPVILGENGYEPWLATTDHPGALQSMLVPLPDDEMRFYPVSPMVNSAAVDTPECVTRYRFVTQPDLFS